MTTAAHHSISEAHEAALTALVSVFGVVAYRVVRVRRSGGRWHVTLVTITGGQG